MHLRHIATALVLTLSFQAFGKDAPLDQITAETGIDTIRDLANGDQELAKKLLERHARLQRERHLAKVKRLVAQNDLPKSATHSVLGEWYSSTGWLAFTLEQDGTAKYVKSTGTVIERWCLAGAGILLWNPNRHLSDAIFLTLDKESLFYIGSDYNTTFKRKPNTRKN